MEYDFTDKVAFITGAANGIGQATANAFHKAGAKLALIDRDHDRGTMMAAQINSRGGEALFIRCDVAVAEEVEQAVRQTLAHFGRLDFAFNDAGIEGEPASIVDGTEANWNRVIGVNLTGVWHCLKYQLREMTRQGHGAIVNCSSVAGLIGFEGSAPYVASKHGVIGLTKTAALEMARQNIRVNAVCPGVIKTEMIERFTHGELTAEAALIKNEPVGRMGEPREIADAVLWLCSPGASFVTGHALPVDGGWMAR